MNASNSIHGSTTALQIIRTACFLTLAGYALKHFAFDGRLIVQIYSEPFIDGCMRLFGLEWKGFFTNEAVNERYRAFIYILGSVFLSGSLLTFIGIPVVQRLKRTFLKLVIGICASLIVLTAVSAFVKSHLHLNMLLEYSIQIMVVLLFLWQALRNQDSNPPLRIVKWAIAATFIGHGLYALNIIPTPSNFLMMTSNILHSGRSATIAFLFAAGILDVVASILIFYKRTERYALAYMVFWGFATALARLTAYYGTAGTTTYLAMWLPEFLVRSGHYLLPLYLLVQSRPAVGGRDI